LEDFYPRSESFLQESKEAAENKNGEEQGFGNGADAAQPDACEESRGEPEQRHEDIIMIQGKISE
jgi:hypothetical protein